MAAKKKTPVSRAVVAKARKVLEFAKQRAREVQNQMELNNALYTPRGMVSISFPTEAERAAFFKTKEFDQILALMVGLPDPPLSDEVIEIRIPPAVNGKSKTGTR
jgi:hypothetical protein